MAQKGKRLTEEEFVNIKQLLNFGINNRKVMDIFSRSQRVISLVKKSTTYGEYKDNMASQNDKYRKDITVTNEQIKSNDPLEGVFITILNDMTELLNNIDKRLEFIEDNMGIPPKRKFF